MTRIHALVLAACAALVGSAPAQPFSIDNHTIDCGGGSSSGGTFQLVGTIGQPEAGGFSAGGGFELAGGFWGGSAGGGGCNIADLALPLGTLDFSDVIAFLTAFGSMQAPADLAPPFGTFDFSDVIAFLTAFGNGCP
ncbi:MAG: GC-type dockerin domain-anchored protein [Phycisphaerales bacterium]